MPRKKQRTPEMRARVLEEAVDLLVSEGIAGFTTRKVADRANTSTPAVYELFEDKRGLVREIYLEGFRQLRRCFESVEDTGDSRKDLKALIAAFRTFAVENPVLAEVMFAHPFSDFSPSEDDLKVLFSVNRTVVKQITRCIEAGVMRGDPIDIAHVLMSTAQGLAAAENAHRLGSTREAIDRRWALAVDSALIGLGVD